MDSVYYQGTFGNKVPFEISWVWSKYSRRYQTGMRFEMSLDRIHYQWSFDRMVLRNIKETMRTVIRERTVIGKRGLQSETIKEIASWLHELEFLIIKVMLFAIGIHHLYVYAMKTMF